ncbi:hypothetical protein L195_g036240, partial [Trifolium pratense]
EPHIVMPRAPATTPCALVSFGCYMPTSFHLDDRLTPQPNTSLLACFVLTRTLSGKIFQKVTHPKTTPSQARLTVEFLSNELPKRRCILLV